MERTRAVGNPPGQPEKRRRGTDYQRANDITVRPSSPTADVVHSKCEKMEGPFFSPAVLEETSPREGSGFGRLFILSGGYCGVARRDGRCREL